MKKVKAVMFKFKKNQEKSQFIIKILHENCDILIQHPYGNYAIQYGFEVKIIVFLIFLLIFIDLWVLKLQINFK